MRFDYQRAWEQKRREIDGERWFVRQVVWVCRACPEEWTVDYDRTPDECPTCGSRDIEPDLTGA